MNNLGFLHTHFIPNGLLKYFDSIYSIIALEFYPDLNYTYYNELIYFTDVMNCLKWHNEKYAGKNVRYTIENINAIKDITFISDAVNQGLIMYQLFHNRSNIYFDIKNGLTAEGIKLLNIIAENDLHLDLSHLNDEQIKNVLQYYHGRCLVSHCVCSDIIDTNHRRHNAISKKTIYELSKRGCIFGIPFVNDIVCKYSHDENENDETIIDSIVAQILCLCHITGSSNVTLAPDFMNFKHFSKVFDQEIKIPQHLYSYKGYELLAERLTSFGLKQKEIEDVFYNNVKYEFFVAPG